MLSLDNLREPITQAEGLARVLELFQALGFDTTGWQEGRIQRTLITVYATLIADFSEVHRIIADAGFNEYASGKLLELFSNSRYQNRKTAAVATQGTCSLISTSSVPYTLAEGALVASTANGVLFRLAQAVTVAAGTVASPVTTPAVFKAMVKGSGGNVPTGAINALLTPLAGVTITNPGTPWYSVTGTDIETDASLKLRNSTQWARLSVELIAPAYENIARDLGATKVKVHDDNPRGAGTIDVYASAGAALLSNAELAVIQAAMATRAFQTSSTWPAASDSRVSVLHPPTTPLPVTATLYHDPGELSSVILERAQVALRDFLTATPLGGWDYSPGPANVVLVSDLHNVLDDVEGVITVVMTVPSATVSIGTLSLVTEPGAGWSLTATPVISS